MNTLKDATLSSCKAKPSAGVCGLCGVVRNDNAGTEGEQLIENNIEYLELTISETDIVMLVLSNLYLITAYWIIFLLNRNNW